MKRELFQISPEDLGLEGKIPLKKLGDSGEVFYELALEMIEEITKNNQQKKPTVLFCPVGPVGQYPIFVRLVNQRKISLKDCYFINMDEYLDEHMAWISTTHALSFRGFMGREVYGKILPELLMPPSQRIFPDPNNLANVAEVIRSVGGVDLALGGIGINGHLAFNEPQPALSKEAFAQLTTRVLPISRETLVANAIGDLGGAIDAMPTHCVTIGMKEILGARKVRLGVFRDWHRAVVRQALYDEVGSHFPATLLQEHPDACVFANQNATVQPF